MSATSTVIERKARATESLVMPAGTARDEEPIGSAGAEASAARIAVGPLASDGSTGAEAAPAGSTPAERPGPLADLSDHGLEVPVLGGRLVPHTNLDLAASAP